MSTIGGSIGKQEQAFVTLIEQACQRQVGQRHVQRRVHAGSCQLPDRHAARELHAADLRRQRTSTSTSRRPVEYDQPTSQQVALTYFQSKPNIQVFCSFGDQMTAGALTAFQQIGITPGKDLQVLRLRRDE